MFINAFGEIFSSVPHRGHRRPELVGKDWNL
jgi:hypothetical protein